MMYMYKKIHMHILYMHKSCFSIINLHEQDYVYATAKYF